MCPHCKDRGWYLSTRSRVVGSSYELIIEICHSCDKLQTRCSPPHSEVLFTELESITGKLEILIDILSEPK
jgi:hypothetical protein